MENYFYDALHNFIFEEAGGGAIRHLADKGYTARRIADSLSFPMPYEKVREAYTKYLLDCAVLLKGRRVKESVPAQKCGERWTFRSSFYYIRVRATG